MNAILIIAIVLLSLGAVVVIVAMVRRNRAQNGGGVDLVNLYDNETKLIDGWTVSCSQGLPSNVIDKTKKIANLSCNGRLDTGSHMLLCRC